MTNNTFEIYIEELVRKIVTETLSNMSNEPKQEEPKYAYNYKELAKHLGCSVTTVSRKKAAGKFDGCYTQIGKSAIYDLNKINEKFAN